MGSAIEQILTTTDEKVKASATDNTPDFLDGKVDGVTVDVNGSDKLIVLPAGVDHNSLLNTHDLTTDIDHNAIANYDANEHVDHTTVTITAGAGLSGGGTIAANRTIDVDINSEVDTVITAADEIMFADVTDSNNIKKDTVQGILDLVPASAGGATDVILTYNSGETTVSGYNLETNATVFTGSYTASSPQYTYWYNNAATSYVQMMPTQYFVKKAGYDTLTLKIRYWGDAAAGQWHRARLLVNGTLFGETATTTSTSPVDGTAVVDVSTLTDDVEYSLQIQMRRQSTSSKVMCGEWYIVAS